MSRSKSPSSSESSPSSYTPGAASVAPDQDSHEGDTPSPSGSMASTLSTVSNVSRKVKRARSTATQPIPKKSMQIKTDKPRPHVCTVCTRAFARLEHLKRHERSHTNEKPFQCACCGRCFARRDLVLRHQQKLHSSIPSIMRRGSGTKDVDAYASEFIIVLSDNTSANAPLPGSVPLQGPNSAPADSSAGVGSAPTPSAGSLSSMGPTGRNASNSTQSPSSIDSTKNILGNYKKNTSSASTSVSTDESALFSPKTEPQFRTAMFSALQTTGSPEDDSSPRKQMKKPHSVASVRMSHDHTRFVPTLPTSAPTSFTPLSFAYSNSRHLSFSAASGTSYTNLKDAMGDDHAPFASPKLEWNLDHLDLSARKSPSMRNLSQFFTQDSISTQPPNSDGAMAAFSFHNPEHPHHLKGMTPFEFDENDNLSALQQMQNHEVSHESSSQVDELSKKRKREPFPRIKLEKNASFTSLPLLLGNDDEWLREILAVPMEKNFPAPSHQVGFNEETAQNVQNVSSVQNGGLNNQNSSNGSHTRSGLNQQLHVDVIGGQTGGPTGQILNSFESPNGPNISSLFKSRQISLVQHLNPSSNSLSDFEFHFDNSPSALLNYNFISPHLRSQIVRMSGLQDDKIPPCEDLNNYLRLYELDFNKYFPFVHLPSLKHPMADNFENIPLLLSMASIGALYSYHDTNTVLLFNLSKFHIQSFFEKEITLDNLQFKKVPLMALQCLVLHIFISMFLNEVNMVDVTSRQIKSMIGLIKSTNFHEPLEMFLNPPEPRAENSGGSVSSSSSGQASASAQQNFDYFILAQSRIRTLHVFYMLQVFRSSVFGTPIHFDSSQLKSGNHCCDEELWHCESATEWSARSASMSDIPPNIVSISNDKSFTSMISMLENTTYTKSSFNNMLALLMYIHEQTQFAKPASPSFSYVDWQLNHVPRLERLVKSWETLFCRAGGILSLGGSITHNEFKLLLPLHSLVRIKLIVNLDPIMSAVVMQNWPQMNRELARLSAHETELQLMRQCIPFCVDLIELWNCNVEAIDPKQISLRSPVFFVTCLFVSVLLMSSYLRHLEGQQPILQPRLPLSQSEAIIWTTIEKALLKVESVLRTISLSSYSENLTANGTFSSIAAGHNSGVVSRLLLDGDLSQVQAEIVSAKLSVKCLYLGVRILADAPVWPIAMGFAEGLKNRAMV